MARGAVAGMALILIAVGCTGGSSDDYVGSSDPVSVVITDERVCNVELKDPEMHGRTWYTVDAVAFTQYNSVVHRPGMAIHTGQLEFDAEDHAVLRWQGEPVEFWGVEPGKFGACAVGGGLIP